MARGFNYAPGASAEVLEAQRPDLHKTHLMALGSSRNTLVRETVAARGDCPLGLMVTLAHDHVVEVRCAIARNPRAQGTVMAYLSADRSVHVLKALLENPSLPMALVEELAFHKKSEVRMTAAARLDAGEAPARTPAAEDSHTPELAEHATIFAMPMTADGAVAPLLEASNVVNIATREPLEAHAPAPAHATAWDEFGRSQSAVPQAIAPHPPPAPAAPTRTAPVRGFLPKP